MMMPESVMRMHVSMLKYLSAAALILLAFSSTLPAANKSPQ